MKSLCVKTNNSEIIDYLLEELVNMDIDDFYISKRFFKMYNNLIIHYLGNNLSLFYSTLSNILTSCIISFYEEKILKNILDYNYFYFNNFEKVEILNNINLLFTTKDFLVKYDKINFSLVNYIKENHSLVIDGFVNFRLKDYVAFLDGFMDLAVNKFLIDKEYNEFVNILRLYINSESQNSKYEHIHLIYTKTNSILVDDSKNIISTQDDIFNAKYLSDISFSSNDYILNTLLKLLPNNITIHIINTYQDEFINTLKLIFQDKISICEDCDICNIYKTNLYSDLK